MCEGQTISGVPTHGCSSRFLFFFFFFTPVDWKPPHLPSCAARVQRWRPSRWDPVSHNATGHKRICPVLEFLLRKTGLSDIDSSVSFIQIMLEMCRWIENVLVLSNFPIRTQSYTEGKSYRAKCLIIHTLSTDFCSNLGLRTHGPASLSHRRHIKIQMV